MIKEFVKAWDVNNNALLESFEKKSPESYQEILEYLIDIVLNPYLEDIADYPLYNGIDINDITKINDGDYQGTILWVMPFNTYQPSVESYIYTYVSYGSCSGCDTFARIYSNYNLYDEDNADSKGAAKDFHKLALHMLQRFNFINSEEQNDYLGLYDTDFNELLNDNLLGDDLGNFYKIKRNQPYTEVYFLDEQGERIELNSAESFKVSGRCLVNLRKL